MLVAGPLFAADPIQEVGKTASEWVNTRAETVRIETDWARNRTLLTGTINGLKERAERLQEQRDHLLASTAEQRAEQADLTARLTQARDNLGRPRPGLRLLPNASCDCARSCHRVWRMPSISRIAAWLATRPVPANACSWW
jgi:hypothetical protein